MKKKFIAIAAAAVAVCSCLALAACSEEETTLEGDYVTITCLDANGETTLKSVPLNPERVAILDYAVLDVMDALGVGDRVVATASGTISYLQEYWDKVDEGEITDLGTLNSYNLELLQQSEPDIIFIGGRQSSAYETLEEIAPVVYLESVTGRVVDGTLENAVTIGKIFGMGAYEVYKVIDEYNIISRMETLSALSANEDGSAKTALNVMYNSSSSFSALASDGRLSLIVNELGFTNVNESYESSSQHGSTTSYEAIAAVNPDYIFVMNRAYITNNDGSSLETAAESVRSAFQTNLTAVECTSTLVVLLNPDVWYTAEGGIQALATMLADLESALL